MHNFSCFSIHYRTVRSHELHGVVDGVVDVAGRGQSARVSGPLVGPDLPEQMSTLFNTIPVFQIIM